jgi:hypothetical protein
VITAEMCVTATDKHINRQRQYKGNNSISFQICPLIGVTKNKYNTEYIQYVLFIGIFRQHIMGTIYVFVSSSDTHFSRIKVADKMESKKKYTTQIHT